MKIHSVDGDFEVIYNPKLERSYTDFLKKEIGLKNKIDIIHEVLHVAIRPLCFEVDIEEELVKNIAYQMEYMALKGHLTPILTNFIF